MGLRTWGRTTKSVLLKHCGSHPALRGAGEVDIRFIERYRPSSFPRGRCRRTVHLPWHARHASYSGEGLRGDRGT